MKTLTIGQVLKSFRQGRELTIKELAAAIGISPAYVSKLESNQSSPTYNMLQKYAAYFGTTVTELCRFAEEPLDTQTRTKLIMQSKLLS